MRCGGAEVRLEPTELIDLGDRFVLLVNMPMRAPATPAFRRRCGTSVEQLQKSVSRSSSTAYGLGRMGF
jgi:hypothetical protein